MSLHVASPLPIILKLDRILNIVCDGKHLHFVNIMDQHSVAHNYETGSNMGNCFTSTLYLKSECQNSFIYRGIQLWKNIPNHLNKLSSVCKLKKHMKCFRRSLPIDPVPIKDPMSIPHGKSVH